jgi:hypothetical protein
MIRSRYLLGMVLLVISVAGGAVRAADAEKPLDNADIIKLTKLEMGDSVIVAKIKSAESVQFATTTDDLVKLKQAGVSKAVMAAMLDRTGAAATHATAPAAAAGTAATTRAAAATAADAGAGITLHSTSGSVALKSIDGDVKTIVAPFVGMKRFIIFPDAAAPVRTKDRKPSVTIAIDKDPRKMFWMVKLDPDHDKDKGETNRSMDVESPGMWGGVMSSAPDSDNMVKCEEQEEKPGVWRYTPLKDLKPGEYGIYVGKGEQTGLVYDFGIDK